MAKEKDSSAVNSMALVYKRSPARPTMLHDIPDKLLKIILLYLTSPHWLVRAAATCKRWRRLVMEGHFLGHISTPNPSSLVAGHYHNHTSTVDGGSISFVPSSPALAVNSRHLSLDFLPGGGSRSWGIVDSHHTLLLLAKKKTGWRHHCFPDLLVCEPITRRCQLIPRMEKMKYHRCIGVFLENTHGRRGATMWDGRTIDTMSSFRVICVLYHEFTGLSVNIGTTKAYLFGEGRRGKRGWFVRQQRVMHKPQIHLHGVESLHFIGRATFSFFWALEDDSSSLLAYNFRWPNEFEIVPLPDHIGGSNLRVIDINNSNLVHVVCLQGNNLCIFTTKKYGSTDWVLQKSLQLMEATHGLAGHKDEYFRGSTKIVSTSMSSIVFSPAEETWLFSIDFETMKVAKCKYKAHSSTCVAYPCELPWLPALRACIVRCSRRGRGRCSDICIC